MEQKERVEAFQKEYKALTEKYQIEIRPVIENKLSMVDLTPKEADVIPAETPAETPTEPAVESAPENETANS